MTFAGMNPKIVLEHPVDQINNHVTVTASFYAICEVSDCCN